MRAVNWTVSPEPVEGRLSVGKSPFGWLRANEIEANEI